MLPSKAMSLLLIPLAPLPYWALGLPWCARPDPRRLALAPLVGCALAGYYAELALVLGLPVRGAVAVLTVISAVASWHLTRDARTELREAARVWLPLYFLSVVASSVSPFPIVGNWHGDWYLLYQMGASVMKGALPHEMLARPPLFGAAAAPLWILGEGLIPYQMMSAVSAASAVVAVLFFVDFFWPKAPRWLLWPLLLSPFFLHNTAAAWGKPLAAGLILGAIIEARRAPAGSRPWASALLLALSVAVHEGSLVWAPCVLAAYAASRRGWRGLLRCLEAMAVAGTIVIGPLLAWILLEYGLAAKIASNPALTAHDLRNQQPFVAKTALVVVTTFVGWEPLAGLARWMRNPHRLSGVVITKESFWFVTSWITTLAGTMLGLLFPFVLCWRRLAADPVLRASVRSPLLLLSVGFALIANGVLCGYFSAAGSMQTGLVPLGLGVYGLLAGAVASDGAAALPTFRRMSWVMAVVGTLPWVLTNMTIAVGLWLSEGFRARMQAGTEGDYARILADHLRPLGMASFPEVPLVATLSLIATLWSFRGAVRRAPAEQSRGG